MAKITLDTILSSFASTSLFNTNFSAIQTDLNDKVLYRNNPMGEPNQMLNDLDMNSNDIINGGTVNTDRLFINGLEVAAVSGVTTRTFVETEFTNEAGQDTFTVSYDPFFVQILINGVQLAQADFTATTGTEIVLAVPLTTNDDILTVIAYQAFEVVNALSIPNNLSDVADVPTSRDNLDVYSKGELYTQTEIQDAVNNENLLYNANFTANQREVSGSIVLAAGEYGHDRWKAGSSGCTYTIATGTDNIRTITISAGSLQQDLVNQGWGGDAVITWEGTSQAEFFVAGSPTLIPTSPGLVSINNTSILGIGFTTGTVKAPKFELGSLPTTFTAPNAEQELQRCLPFYERKLYTAGTVLSVGQATGTDDATFDLQFTEKRIVPTVTFPNQGVVTTAVGGQLGGTPVVTLTETDRVTYTVNAPGTFVAGNATMYQAFGGAGTTFIADAEI